MNKTRIDCHEDPDGSIGMYVPPELTPHFKKLVERAMMTWQEPHPQIRDFADRLSGLSKLLPKTELAGSPVTKEEK
jgi:hypothetical protein